jgi:hypothetical protein
MVMGAGLRRRAGHAAYIRAVCRAIEARDIRVIGTETGVSVRHGREATLTLRPDQEAFAEPVPAEAQVFWDEENGWSLRAGRGPIGDRISKGLDVLPGPEDVATWVMLALTHRELTPSYEHEPFRDCSVSDPDFEARLSGPWHRASA